MLIPNYTRYDYTDGAVTDLNTGKQLNRSAHNSYKLKDDAGNWKAVAVSRVKALCGDTLQLPTDARPIPYTPEGEYFIDPRGTVYAFTRTHPAGTTPSITRTEGSYSRVSVHYKGSQRSVELQQLLAVTFILEDYIERGLVCVMLDDDKANAQLNNIAIGTYSSNNKNSYSRGLNRGNGLKKQTSSQWNAQYQYVILDHDGWNRKDFTYSFNEELITEAEFLKRVSASTIMFNRKDTK